jgi:hypothetical protein
MEIKSLEMTVRYRNTALGGVHFALDLIFMVFSNKETNETHLIVFQQSGTTGGLK